jgi:hypothetical protein
MTGVDLAAAGYVLPEPEAEPDEGPITDARLDADTGLPLSDADAVARHPPARHLAHGLCSESRQVVTSAAKRCSLMP